MLELHLLKLLFGTNLVSNISVQKIKYYIIKFVFNCFFLLKLLNKKYNSLYKLIFSYLRVIKTFKNWRKAGKTSMLATFEGPKKVLNSKNEYYTLSLNVF